MPGRSLSRRTTLGSALAAPIVLAACDIDPPPRASGTSSPTPEPPEDSALVASRRGRAGPRAGRCWRRPRQPCPPSARASTRSATAHTAHLDVLVGAVPEADVPTASPPRSPPTAEAALAAVRRSEQRLLREVRTGCLAAASGDLARVLASVAASTSQHAAALARGRRRMSVLDALQVTLGDEHAALYTYGVLGCAHLAGGDAGALRRPRSAAYRRHRARRDQLRVLVDEAGGEPVTAAAAYELDGPLLRSPQVQAAALATEESSVEVLTRPGRPVGRAPCASGPSPRRPGRPPGSSSWAAARRPGRERPSSTGLDEISTGSRSSYRRSPATGNGPRPQPLGKSRDLSQRPRTRTVLMGLVSITLCGPSCGGGGTTCTIMHSIRRMRKHNRLACSCNAQSCRTLPAGPRSARRRTLVPGPHDGRDLGRADVTLASGSPSVWPTCSAGIVLSGTWIARRPALWAPQTSSKSRSPT